MDTARGSNPQVYAAHPRAWGFDPSRLADFLADRHPGSVAKSTARATGAPVKTVERWMQGQAPGLVWFMALVGAYGPELVDACCERPPAWISTAALEQRRERVLRHKAQLEDELRAMS